MEITCSRCHRTVEPGASFCPACGLPQLVYSSETPIEQSQPARWDEAVLDAGSVAWRPALRTALSLAIPAGVICAFLAPVGILGLLVMGVTGAWAVSLYMRSQRPAWITTGAGARIGLVTGLVGSWTAAATAGALLYGLRYWFHQGRIFDNFWNTMVTQQIDQQLSQEWTAMGESAKDIATLKAWVLSPEGRAAWVLAAMAFLVLMLTVCAIAGGALSARINARRRRPEA